MQHDLYVHPDRRLRRHYPFLVDLQSAISADRHRIVAPLSPVSLTGSTPARIRPIIQHDGEHYSVMMGMMHTTPVRILRHTVGSIAPWRDDITLALDWLFFGL